MARPGGLSRGRLIVLVGLPGAGKSTLARALAARLPAQIVDRDALRAQRYPGVAVDAAISAAANAEMEDAIRARLRRGATVIADGRSFARAAERDRLAAQAAALCAPVVFVWVDVPVALARARVEGSRAQHPASDRNAALVDAIAARFEPPAPAIRVDGRWPPQRQADAVVDALAAVYSGSSAPLE